METVYIAIVLMMIVAAGLIYYGYSVFIKNKRLPNDRESTIDIDALIDALGGIDNIVGVDHSASKVSVELKDYTVVNIEKIQSLGASGIVEGQKAIAMIFGKQSVLIANDIMKMK